MRLGDGECYLEVAGNLGRLKHLLRIPTLEGSLFRWHQAPEKTFAVEKHHYEDSK